MHENFYKMYHWRATTFLKRIHKELNNNWIPLQAECANSRQPVPWRLRHKLDYRPIAEGDKWGDKWESGWFRFKVTVPENLDGKELALDLNLGGESMLFTPDGVPLYGLSGGTVYIGNYEKTRYVLPDPGRGGQTLFFEAEAAANAITGIFLPEADELQTPHPLGHYTAIARKMRLLEFKRELWHLALDFEVVLSLLDGLGTKDYRALQLLDALNAAMNRYGDSIDNAGAARSELAPVLSRPATYSALTAHAVGHAHIDVGWLWPVRESRRKVARTFSSQLELIRKYPEYKFGASQAVLYDFARLDYPELFKKIQTAVREGSWEIQGGMWVEADANLISGESMVRQFLYGKNFFMDHFGVDVKNLWIPDVFGYSAAMPQIIKKSGCDYFLTQKLSWNEINRFPHQTFNWVGVDGSVVLTHFPPENTYISLLLPENLVKAQNQFPESHLVNDFISLFGIGDGGGGPTEEMVERGLRMRNLEGTPRLCFDTAANCFERLAERQERLPQWHGELYLEKHRATLTNQARTKRGNRQCEQALGALEFLASLLPPQEYPAAELDELWKTVLTNQFHDILPGSSIREVYETTEAEHAHVLAKCAELTAATAEAVFPPAPEEAAAVNSLSAGGTFVVEMPENWGPYAVLDSEGRELPCQLENHRCVAALELPGTSCTGLKRGRKLRGSKVKNPDGLVLENAMVRYEFSDTAELISAYDKIAKREILSSAGNRLTLYHDFPVEYDAWDTDVYYRDMQTSGPEPVNAVRSAEGKVRSTLEFTLRIGNSTLIQKISLGSHSRQLDFHTSVEWREVHRLLRVAFPTTVTAEQAAFDIQYAYVNRTTHCNTSWDEAQFEVCGQRYADLSAADYGVALLNDCKYGYRVRDGVLDLALLRASKKPDFYSDQGHHEFTYSLLPHIGGLVESDVIESAAKLNRAPQIFVGRSVSEVKTPVHLESSGIALEAVKKAAKSNDLIVRLVETRGLSSRGQLQVNIPGEISVTDLMEWQKNSALKKVGGALPVTLKPFEILTLRIAR